MNDLTDALRPLVGELNGPPLYQKIRQALQPVIDAKLRDHHRRVFVDSSAESVGGAIEITVRVPVTSPVRYIHVDWAEDGPPPEPSAIDRIAALDDREAAWRCADYDRWWEARGKAAP